VIRPGAWLKIASSELAARSCSLELREKGDKFFGSEETLLAGLPQSLECLLHESEVGRDYRVNVNEKAQLLRIALPVGVPEPNFDFFPHRRGYK
jgi:hypothetical protein